jgi:hypothetical protein
LELIPVGLIPPSVAIIGSALGVHVWLKGPQLPTTRAFLLAMGLFAAGSVLDFGLIVANDYQVALWLARAMLFDIVLLFASTLYLASFLPYERFSGWFQGREKPFAVLAVVSAVLAVLPLDAVTNSGQGWDETGSLAFAVWTSVVMAYIIITIYMLHRTSKGVRWTKTKKQTRLLSLSLISPVLYALALQGLYSNDISIPSTLSPGFLLLAIVMAYGILRYRLFLPPLAQELRLNGVSSPENQVQLGKGLLLVEEKHPVLSYQAFLSILAQGSGGLIITRSSPEMIRQDLKLEKTPVLWLASQPGPSRIDPANLLMIKQIVLDFLRKGEKAAVILDSLEYLMQNNPPQKVMFMLQDLSDEVLGSGSTLILSIDPWTIEPAYLAILEREFQLVVA